MRDPDPTETPRSDAVYDAYLDACLAGTAEDPNAYCLRHEVDSADLRARFEALYAEMTRTSLPATPDGGAAHRSPADSGLPFARLGDFTLLRQLDQGGMGAVYLARQDSLGRNVALKVIRPELSGSPLAAERFRREARSLARLRHRNIVAVHAVGEALGVRFLAMELVEGRTLDAIIRDAAAQGATVPATQAAAWVRDIAEALEYAHSQGVIHRDVKPSNVCIAPDGRPLLLDFGIAKDLTGDDAHLTRTFAGSPIYAAPEQLAGAAADHRADVYGLGVVLYQCLTGRLPFVGGSMEEVLSRVLVEDVLPPRRLNPTVPRDLETVTLHALEKDPHRRYQSAAALAADLDAAIGGRPIAIRPPGAVDRLRKWRRRRPAIAAVAATLALGAMAAAAGLVVRDTAAREERRTRAARLVDSARAGLVAYRKEREAAATLEREAADLRSWMTNRHLTAEEDAARDAKDDAAAAARRGRETNFFEVLDLLRAAELENPETAGAQDVRAELFRERWRDARAARDAEAVRFYGDLVARHDATGRFAAELRGASTATIRSDPPGATVYLFDVADLADVVPGGEHRLVPVPRAGAPRPVAPGTPSLRVVRGSGEVAVDDLIVALAGRPIAEAYLVIRGGRGVERLDRFVGADGVVVRSRSDLADACALGDGEHVFAFERAGRTIEVRAASLAAAGIEVADAEDAADEGDLPATLVHDGEPRAVVLPRGLELRRTEAPVMLSRACVVGTTPLEGLALGDGEHLAVIEAPGRPRVRVALRSADDGGRGDYDIRLPPAGAVPAGFAYVPRDGEGAEDVWMMEREVTAAEYLEFLDDPAVRARIDASAEPVLYPRTPDNRRDGGTWKRGPDGRFVLPAAWRPDWPVLGVSWNDAREYAAWRTTRDARHPPLRLPTFPEWRTAAGAAVGRTYSYGNRFHARWVKSCFSRPHPSPEPVRSYPTDESAYGVFDLTGGAYEWVDGWWDESRGQRRLAGGSWAQGEAGPFNVWGGTGADPAATSEEFGFRLVMNAWDAAR